MKPDSKQRVESRHPDAAASAGVSGPIANRGFSLLELLVVVSILGVLFALAVPVVGNALVRGKQSACASNLRQLGMAFNLYAAEHDGKLPPTRHSASWRRSEQTWIYQLAPYLNDIDAIRVCPAEPPERRERILQSDQDDQKATSYVCNNLVFDYDEFNRLPRIPSPSATMLLFILTENRTPGPSWDHVHAENWNNWQGILADVEVDRHRVGRRAPDRLEGSANYLFADGHVENIEASEMKERINSGVNPAVPPTDG